MLSDVVWDVGKTGKIAPVAWLEPVFVGGTTVTRATLANQEVIRARGHQDRRHRAGAPRRRRDPVRRGRAGRVQAHGRGAGHRPAVGVPLVRAAADRAGQQSASCSAPTCACPAQTVRRLIHWASRAAADIEAVGRCGSNGSPSRAIWRIPSDFYALTKEQLLEFDRIGEVSAARMIESIDASPPRRPAPRADRPRHPDGLRRHRRPPVPRGLRLAGGGRRRGRGDARRGRRHRPEGRRLADRAPHACPPRARPPPRTAASPWTCATRTSRPVVAAARPWRARPW